MGLPPSETNRGTDDTVGTAGSLENSEAQDASVRQEFELYKVATAKGDDWKKLTTIQLADAVELLKARINRGVREGRFGKVGPYTRLYAPMDRDLYLRMKEIEEYLAGGSPNDQTSDNVETPEEV